jgi:hypothetical protein
MIESQEICKQRIMLHKGADIKCDVFTPATLMDGIDFVDMLGYLEMITLYSVSLYSSIGFYHSIT